MTDNAHSNQPGHAAVDQSTSDPSTDPHDFRAVNKARLFGVLSAAGITTVTVTFDGYGDSGQIESIEARSAADETLELPSAPMDVVRPISSRGERETITVSVPEAIETFVYDLLETAHGGWEDNEGSYGDFIFDVTHGRIALSFNERFVGSELSQHIF